MPNLLSPCCPDQPDVTLGPPGECLVVAPDGVSIISVACEAGGACNCALTVADLLTLSGTGAPGDPWVVGEVAGTLPFQYKYWDGDEWLIGEICLDLTAGDGPASVQSSDNVCIGEALHFWSAGSVTVDLPGGNQLNIEVEPSADIDNALTLGSDGRLYVATGGGGNVVVKDAGAVVGSRPAIDFYAGPGIALTITDDPVSNDIDVMIAATGGGGGALSGPPSIIVCSADARQEVKDFVAATATYGFICDGVNDEVEILAAFSALNSTPYGFGRVIMSAGGYVVQSPIDYVLYSEAFIVHGQGREATWIYLDIPGSTFFGWRTGVYSKTMDLTIEDVGTGTFTEAPVEMARGQLDNVRIIQGDSGSQGALMLTGGLCDVRRCTVQGGGHGSGIYMHRTADGSIVLGNEIVDAETHGIEFPTDPSDLATGCYIAGNTIWGASQAGSGLYDGIHLANPGAAASQVNQIANNIVRATATGIPRDAVRLEGANLQDNVVCANIGIGITGVDENDLGTNTRLCI